MQVTTEMHLPVADLHCDLLSYLEGGYPKSPLDEAVRCSLPQLKKGGVSFQAMAVYTETKKGSVLSAEKQVGIFQSLLKCYPETLASILSPVWSHEKEKTRIALAIENASGLCEEEEPLEKAFERLLRFHHLCGPILYVSLTWNHENRFAGGNLSSQGLRRDGEILLEHLDALGIAVDLSHASDATAYGILNYIDKKGLTLIPIASHSNFRAVAPVARNLTDEMAKEIVGRGGVIGLNFFKHFLGNEGPDDFIAQIEHGKSLGVMEHFCFGADFFYDQNLPPSLYSYPFYHESFDNAGCYPRLLSFLKKILNLDELEQIASKNFSNFYERRILSRRE